MKTNDACLSNFLKDEVNLQTISENQKDYGISPNSTKCVYDEKKSESGIHNIKILSKAAASDSEPSKLSKPDDETFSALELFSDALQDTKTISPDNLQNVDTVDVVPIDEKAIRSNTDTFDHKEGVVENTSVLQTIRPQLNTACYKCGKEVDVSYIAKKTHALQFHFTQDDDPEIAELLPATIKACFPHSLAWSDYQCTECGKALGTYSSRRNHVLREHFYWSTICPFSGCTTVINALGALEEHFKFEHNISKLKMPKRLKHTLKEIENNRKNDLHRQLNHCFPCSIPPKKQVIFKESTYESRHLPKPSITSILSSLLHSQPINNAKKKKFAYSSSDDESSSIEDEDSSGIKDKKHDIMNQKGEPVNTNISAECSRNVNDSDSNITCHNFYNQEKLNIVRDKERYCTICHSQYFETNE
ncbi:unnamed protein product [Onchocerca ochengi]|uniref:C2H2-type domain-containing protein n=1 Tax=Onchocerca ochengi TaxID=42157 RepID=A0A182E4A6_ONCOC|nr:unnamed protein product [Onchocerca ochengi]